MRVFYIDEEESKRHYYVRIENVNLPESMKGYITIEAVNVEDLVEKIKLNYGFKTTANIGIELWAGQRHISQRLDIMDEIPKGIEFISGYVVNYNKTN
jgi:hypothetical protein